MCPTNERIEARMRSLRVSWSELARVSDVDRRTLYTYRHEGWVDARLYTMRAIALRLDVPVGWLLGETDIAPAVHGPSRPEAAPKPPARRKKSIPRRMRKPRSREERRLEKQRQRARWRKAGLNASGKPVKDRARQDRALIAAGQCPQGCGCFDCLWGAA